MCSPLTGPAPPLPRILLATHLIVAFEQDLVTDAAPQAIVEAALKHFGALDILFSNAGVSHRALAAETTDDDWDRVFAVNVRAPFRLCRAAIPALRERAAVKGRARIINTASVMAFDTDIGLAAYTASKHAVAGLTKTLALELGQIQHHRQFPAARRN